MASRMTSGCAGNPNAKAVTMRKGGFTLSHRIANANKEAVREINPIVVYPGSYVLTHYDEEGSATETISPHGQILRHYSPITKRYVRCTDGLRPGYNQDKEYTLYPAGLFECCGCVEADKPKNERKVSFASPATVWNVITLGYFHQVESDRINERTKKPYINWEKCAGKTCKRCEAGVERTFGHKECLTLNWSQSRQFTRYDLLTLAGTCACGGEIEARRFCCEKCKVPHVDFESEAATDAQLLQLRSMPYTCKSCGTTAPLIEEYVCDKCKAPKPLSLDGITFKIYFPAKSTDQKEESESRKDTTLVFSPPRVLTEQISEEIKPLMKPFDLDAVHPRLSMAQQAKVLGITNPFTNKKADPVERKAAPPETDGPQGGAAWDDENPF